MNLISRVELFIDFFILIFKISFYIPSTVLSAPVYLLSDVFLIECEGQGHKN